MANVSRDLWVDNNEEIAHYDMAVLQMGVPVLDADFNIAQDIRRWQDRRMMTEVVGNGVILDSFKITEKAGDLNNNFLINIAGTYPGLVFVNGWIGRFEATQDYKTQADWLAWGGSGEPAPLFNTTGFVSPTPALTTPGGVRTDSVYVCLWEYEVNSTSSVPVDTGIKDPTLAVETCRRKKVMVFVLVDEGSVINPVSDATHQYFKLATIVRVGGDSTITNAMITDERGKPARGLIAVNTEVETARGSVGTLDTRLSVSLQATGRLKDSCLNANWDAGDYQIRAKQFYADIPAGTAPIVLAAGNNTKVTDLNADQLDGYDATNATASIPISNGTVNTDLNADKLDGYHAANTTGAIPISNGTVNTDLNADKLDGQDLSYALARANHTGTQAISTLSDHNQANHNSLNITPGNGTVTNAKLSLTGLALTSPLTMGGSNITGIGDLGTSAARVTNAYITNLYVADLNFLNKWKIDDLTDELLFVSPEGKKFRVALTEVK